MIISEGNIFQKKYSPGNILTERLSVINDLIMTEEKLLNALDILLVALKERVNLQQNHLL
jgi:hypothetical protein